jgi:3-deoxy-manno-octulosonate cytidylyltransferase (CMP-KDO synthetase)
MKERIIAVIPARWQSSRFPGKPLALLAGKPVIQHVYENVESSGIFEQVIVATDSIKIKQAIENFGGKAMLTSEDHHSGTDRIAEICKKLDFDIVVNVQGDEPFLTAEPLRKLVQVFENPQVRAATLMHELTERIDDPNQVKVVFDNNNFALYFSRLPLPYNRDGNLEVKYFGHIGVYAFRRETLFKFISLPPGKLENAEKLEQLRLLENHIPIKMVLTNYSGFGIDTPEDLEAVKKNFTKTRNN